MKNQIYTIPINEAFDGECTCPLCKIEDKLDREAVEYTLGAAMMEPDFRIKTNEKGFCTAHFETLSKQGKALPLALIMQSMSEVQNKLIAKNLPLQKTGLLGKASKKQSAAGYVTKLNEFISSCAICEKTEKTMDGFLKNIIFLWKTENEFTEKFKKSTFCVPHFTKLAEYAIKGLGESDFEVFFDELQANQIKTNAEMHEDISRFTELFDHRSTGSPNPKVKSALKRCIHNYSGLMQND